MSASFDKRESALGWLVELQKLRVGRPSAAVPDGVEPEDVQVAAQVHALVYIGDQIGQLAGSSEVRPGSPGIGELLRTSLAAELQKQEGFEIGDTIELRPGGRHLIAEDDHGNLVLRPAT